MDYIDCAELMNVIDASDFKQCVENGDAGNLKIANDALDELRVLIKTAQGKR